MQLRNAIFYTFKSPFTASAREIEDALRQKAFQPCLKNQVESRGWANPRGIDRSFGIAYLNECVLLHYVVDSKSISKASVMDEALARKAEVRSKEGREMDKHEWNALVDQVHFEFVQSTQPKKSGNYAYIDIKNQILIVGAAKEKSAEVLTGALREALGSLPVERIKTMIPTSSTLTRWVKTGDVPASIIILDEAVLTDDEGGTITFKKQYLLGKDVRNQIDSTRKITKLRVKLDKRITMTIDENLVLTKMKIDNDVTDSIKDMDSDDGEAIFDATMFMATEEYRNWHKASKTVLHADDPQGALF